MKFFVLLVIFAAMFLSLIFSGKAKSLFGEQKIYPMNDKREDLANFECSEGWRITGYFTPIETEYNSAKMKEVKISGVGEMSFDADFVRVVFDENEGWGEGWGKTRFGWYLGNYNGKWHKADAPLDANGAPLKSNSVAVDNDLIPNDSILRVPGLPGEFGRRDFIANDVGVTVHGKHIDIYTGEGRQAERKMYNITFEDADDLQKVCYRMPQQI